MTKETGIKLFEQKQFFFLKQLQFVNSLKNELITNWIWLKSIISSRFFLQGFFQTL